MEYQNGSEKAAGEINGMANVSIIVPVYNARKYLDQCVASLTGQTYQDIEIILVDDGSTDGSGEICDCWARSDGRIIVIHKVNEGLAKARAEGIQKASAMYVAFLDSDDYFDPDFCEKMLYVAQANDADLVECAYRKFGAFGIREHHIWSGLYNLTQQDFINQVVRHSIVSGTEAVVVWNKLYKRQIIYDTVKEIGSSPLEDYLFNMQYYMGVSKYVYVDACLVNYRQVAGSLSRRRNPRTFEILNDVELQKREILRTMGLVSEADSRAAARWYADYVYNFLKSCAADGAKDIVIQALQDGVLRENCLRIRDESRFAAMAVAGQYARVYRLLRGQALLDMLRSRLATTKNKYLNRMR